MNTGGNDSFVDTLISRIEHTDAANDNGKPTAATFRIVIEDEATGREFLGWGGLIRERVDLIAGFIDNRGVAQEKIGRMPARRLNLDGLARNRGRR